MKILIGIAGYRAAGKTLFRTLATHLFPVEGLDIEEVVREVAAGWGLPLNPTNLRQIDGAIRDGMGGHFLLAAESQVRQSLESSDVVLVDSLRNWTDYLDLRTFADQVELVGVLADSAVRHQRIRERRAPGDPRTPRGFAALAAEEAQDETARLLAAAGHTVHNQGDRAGFEIQVRQVMEQILPPPYLAH